MPDVFFTTPDGRQRLDNEMLLAYMQRQRWFGGKGRVAVGCSILKEAPLGAARLLAVDVKYWEGPNDLYCLPVALAEAAPPDVPLITRLPHGWVLFDAVYDPAFRQALFILLAEQAAEGEVRGECGKILREMFAGPGYPESRVLTAEQSNTSLIYGGKLFVKLYRRIAPGVNPDAEITRFLSEEPRFRHAPAFGGQVEWVDASLALATELRANEGNAWELALSHFRAFASDPRALAAWTELASLLGRRTGLFHRALMRPYDTPERLREIQPGRPAAKPQRTEAELAEVAHGEKRAAVAGWRLGAEYIPLRTRDAVDLRAAFVPEWSATDRKRKWHEELETLCAEAEKMLAELSSKAGTLPAAAQEVLELLARERQGNRWLPWRCLEKVWTPHTESADEQILLTRTHGDYHLGQVLFSEGDFVLIDFEGEPLRSLEERRAKHPPIRDVAGMLRSLHYAAHAARGDTPIHDAERWAAASQQAFLEGWRGAVRGLPIADEQMLHFYLFEKLIYEVQYEMNNRPDWVHIPLRGLVQ